MPPQSLCPEPDFPAWPGTLEGKEPQLLSPQRPEGQQACLSAPCLRTPPPPRVQVIPSRAERAGAVCIPSPPIPAQAPTSDKRWVHGV